MRSAFRRYFGDEQPELDRRFKPGFTKAGNKNARITQLWDRHLEMLRMKAVGMRESAIAESLGCTTQTVVNTVNSRIGQQHLMVLRGSRDADAVDLVDRIRNFAPKCLDLLEDVVQGKGPGNGAKVTTRLSAAKDLLNRLPEVSPHSRKDTRSMQITPDDISRIKQRALEEGIVKDVSPNEAQE